MKEITSTRRVHQVHADPRYKGGDQFAEISDAQVMMDERTVEYARRQWFHWYGVPPSEVAEARRKYETIKAEDSYD